MLKKIKIIYKTVFYKNFEIRDESSVPNVYSDNSVAKNGNHT